MPPKAAAIQTGRKNTCLRKRRGCSVASNSDMCEDLRSVSGTRKNWKRKEWYLWSVDMPKLTLIQMTYFFGCILKASPLSKKAYSSEIGYLVYTQYDIGIYSKITSFLYHFGYDIL